MGDLVLRGLDAANLLGYLAALGTLRSATLVWPEVTAKMDWTMIDGMWRPRLLTKIVLDPRELVTGLAKQLSSSAHLNALNLSNDLTISVEAFRGALLQVQQHTIAAERRDADFLAAFGSDAVEARDNGKPNGQIADTAFRTMSGAGHQHFLSTMRAFVTDTNPEHLEKALFRPWQYDDPLENHSMRWDPMDDIRYALRWDNPSGDKSRKTGGSMWGANRLAIEALPLFPVFPVNNRLETTGFTEKGRASPIRLTWPVWSGAIGLDSLRSLLASPELQEVVPNRRYLHARGIVEVFRCERITQGKYRNFSTALPV